MFPEERLVEFEAAANVVFRAAETIRESSVVEGRGRERRFGSERGSFLNGRRRRSALTGRGSRYRAQTDDPQLVVNQPRILGANALKIRRQPLLDFNGGAVQCAQIIAVLRLYDFPEVRFDERDAVLEGALDIGGGAKELHFIHSQLALPLRPPRDPVMVDVPHLIEIGPELLVHLGRE